MCPVNWDSPFYPDGEVLWRYAEDIDLTIFGTSAKYIDAMKKTGLRPAGEVRPVSIAHDCVDRFGARTRKL